MDVDGIYFYVVGLLCNVEKKVPIFFITSKILLFDQPVDSLFDARHVGNKVPTHGLNCLKFYLFVRELLARLHDAHNRRVEVMLPVALDCALCVLRFLGLQKKKVTTMNDDSDPGCRAALLFFFFLN
jgi:hypothetical protein